MSHVFDLESTRKQQILVEYLTATGSGFAINPQGEQVFMNKRLIDAMGVKPGDYYEAYLLPNYADKRDQIPWRAMRVEPVEVDLDLSHVAGSAIENAIVDYMRDVDSEGVFEVCDISDDMDLDFKQVEEALKNNPDLFERVDAYVLHPKAK